MTRNKLTVLISSIKEYPLDQVVSILVSSNYPESQYSYTDRILSMGTDCQSKAYVDGQGVQYRPLRDTCQEILFRQFLGTSLPLQKQTGPCCNQWPKPGCVQSHDSYLVEHHVHKCAGYTNYRTDRAQVDQFLRELLQQLDAIELLASWSIIIG